MTAEHEWDGRFATPRPKESFVAWLNRAVQPYFPESVELYLRRGPHSNEQRDAFWHGMRIAEAADVWDRLHHERPSAQHVVERLVRIGNARRDLPTLLDDMDRVLVIL